ncbi:MAG: hypothetical protein ABI895_19530 [Deltaproteobacteria bacterium]
MILRSQKLVWMGGLLAAALVLSEAVHAKDEGDKGGRAKPAAAAKGQPSEGQPKGEGQGKEKKGPHAEHAKGPAAEAASEKGGSPAHAGRAASTKQAAGNPSARAEQHAEREELKSKLTELRERQAQGKLSKEELKKELATLRESRGERRQSRREALHKRWGHRLAEPTVQQELRHHERRMARLERMALLAQTDRSGAAKEALVARIGRLTAQEKERHERKMSQLETKPGSTQPASAVEPAKGTQAAPPIDKAAEKKGAAQ